MAKQKQRKNYYLPRHKLEDLLDNIGVEISSDTGTDLICYCPFHSNHDSPAFNISLRGPHLWKCHNAKCGSKGNVVSLLTKKGYSFQEAERMVLKGSFEVSDLANVISELLEDPKDEKRSQWEGKDPHAFAQIDEECGYPARDYFLGRGITQEAIDFFQLGYSGNKKMAVIPTFDEANHLCGVIGRVIEGKRYQYSTGLARSEIVWNLNNVKQYDRIVLTEGALDAIYLWQAGIKEACAILGSAIGHDQWKSIRKYFSEVVCFFDNDAAGESLTSEMMGTASDLEISRVTYPDRLVSYVDADGETQQRPVKDPGELEPSEIVEMMDNRKTQLEFVLES